MRNSMSFNEVWCNQNTLGKQFGISVFRVGKILEELGLKDVETRLATLDAITDGYARHLKCFDDTEYCVWHRELVGELISERLKKVKTNR